MKRRSSDVCLRPIGRSGHPTLELFARRAYQHMPGLLRATEKENRTLLVRADRCRRVDLLLPSLWVQGWIA